MIICTDLLKMLEKKNYILCQFQIFQESSIIKTAGATYIVG